MTRPATSNGIPKHLCGPSCNPHIEDCPGEPIAVPTEPGMNDRTTLAAVNHLRKLVRFHYPNASDAAINATARLLAVRAADHLDRNST